jgi:transposase
MRPKGAPEELERRRRRAVELVERGESPTQVARILGVQTSSVHRWRRLARRPHGLDARPAPGPTPGLSGCHLKKLERLLAHGARMHGWPNELWTAARVARLIREPFGRSYHPEHARKILKQRLGWTRQKARRKPRERDDKQVERWLADELPRILAEQPGGVGHGGVVGPHHGCLPALSHTGAFFALRRGAGRASALSVTSPHASPGPPKANCCRSRPLASPTDPASASKDSVRTTTARQRRKTRTGVLLFVG